MKKIMTIELLKMVSTIFAIAVVCILSAKIKTAALTEI